MCTGKNVADVVESMLGAVFLSTNLRRTLQLISDIQLVPLEQANLLDHFPNRSLTFDLREELEKYDHKLMDDCQALFEKYWAVDQIDPIEKNRVQQLIDPSQPVMPLGSAIQSHFKRSLHDFEPDTLQVHLINCLSGLEKRLGYSFKDKGLLLEAMTHSSFMETYDLPVCYEKLEVLGDSILDYVANANLIKFTMFERYNMQERLEKQYIT